MVGGMYLILLIFLTAPFALVSTLVYLISKKKGWAVCAMLISLISIWCGYAELIGANEEATRFYSHLLTYNGACCLVITGLFLFLRRKKIIF